MSTGTMTRLGMLREADKLTEALHAWRNVCTERYGVRVPFEVDGRNYIHVIHSGAETRNEQAMRHNALETDCLRALGYRALVAS